MVVDMLCSNGRNDTPVWQRIFWAAGAGLVAIILLLAGGLGALQTMAIASALPFTIVLLIATYGLVRALQVDVYKKETLQNNYLMASAVSHQNWRERLHTIIDFPSLMVGQRFLKQVVQPALNEVAEELRQAGLSVELELDDQSVKTFRVMHGEELDFIYQVQLAAHVQPSFTYNENDPNASPDEHTYYRAEVHLREGGQDYDILGWSRDAVISDLIEHYHKHMHFLHVLR